MKRGISIPGQVRDNRGKPVPGGHGWFWRIPSNERTFLEQRRTQQGDFHFSMRMTTRHWRGP